MRKISASYIVPGDGPPLKNGILVTEDDGTVADIIDTGGTLREQAGLEQYSGVLVPGFINTHCHLELSHLRGKIPEKSTFAGFLGHVNRLRNQDATSHVNAIEKADFEMQYAGIVAVGDVSNSMVTLDTKRQSKIYYHTFAEAFGFHPLRAEKAFAMAEFVQEMFVAAELTASVTPHSAYSVSEPLFLKIKEKALTDNGILSVHNQESLAEEDFFRGNEGPVFNHLTHVLGLDTSQWEPHREGTLQYILSMLPEKNRLLLVHNTCTTPEDIRLLKRYRNTENTFLVVCPNSNLYIENTLPPVNLFRDENLNICLGTDSLASNSHLSVLKEMITLQKHFPDISIADLVEWACLNGARALQIDHRFGSFTAGKKPGINLITGVDLKLLKLTPASKVKALQQPA